jgi:thiol-disulfide isomerase/thioredoxin
MNNFGYSREPGGLWVRLFLMLALVSAPMAAAQNQRRTPDGQIITRPAKDERYHDTLQAGDAAPDFTLPDQNAKSEVRLSSFRGKKPVVLIFGSYTCPPFRREIVELEELYQDYKDRALFLLVYIREAHPDSVLRVLKNGEEVLRKIEQTNTLEERREVAQQCTAYLKLSMPTLIDKPDNKVNAAYAAWPNRLAIVDVDGKLAYYSRRGPAGFKPQEIEAWLERNPKAAP